MATNFSRSRRALSLLRGFEEALRRWSVSSSFTGSAGRFSGGLDLQCHMTRPVMVATRFHHSEQCGGGLGCGTHASLSTSTHASAGSHGLHANPDLAKSKNLDIIKSVEQASHLLPHQGIMENFVHHNPLEDYEHMNFNSAVDHVHRLESYLSPAERAFLVTQVDVRKRVDEALTDLGSAFLDRGVAKWTPKFRERGFLYFFANLEGLGFAAWRKHARRKAAEIMEELEKPGNTTQDVAATFIRKNLEAYGIPRDEWTPALRAMLLELRGWAGMFHRMETHPHEAPTNTKVTLIEFCAVKSILIRSSIEALAKEVDWDPAKKSLAMWLKSAPSIRQPEDEDTLHTSAIAYIDQSSERRQGLETEFKHSLLNAIGSKPLGPDLSRSRPSFQMFTCIDDRECSLRRHVEAYNPREIETFGVAGFFGIPIRYRPADGRDEMILAPEGQSPKEMLIELENPADHDKMVQYHERRKRHAQLNRLAEDLSFSPLGSIFLTAFFPFSLGRLLAMGHFPAIEQNIKERLLGKFIPTPRTDFRLPFPPEEAAAMLARTLKDVGMTADYRFAPVVLILGHGATSVNNPFAAAYNCGACGGREGGPNARLMARLVNDKDVRRHLVNDHKIPIPEDTIFVGAMHNTTADTIEYFDAEAIPASHQQRFAEVQEIMEEARGKNALERCDRFLLAENVKTPEAALKHVKNRATDPAEARPELNHSTNAAVVVGRRALTKGRFLDRRVFLPSYDPYSDDDQGTNLEHVLAPALVVCSGINLEYLFSTISTDHHGAGTKAPLNIVGNIGVLQGVSGDLRPGLPTQMTEMHIPVRSLFIVDSPIERVEAVLQRRERLRNLVRNEWVRFIVRVPETGRYYIQTLGEYLPIDKREMAKHFVPFTPHKLHGLGIAHKESFIYYSNALAMILSCAVPVYMYGAQSMSPYGSLIAICGTLLSLPVLSFSRRYLHGEFMFGRFAALSTGLLLGFNLVATAPDIPHAMEGWGLFGFASAFLIGAYNDRPTVRNNATFAFAAYRISDLALLVAATYSAPHIFDASFHGVPHNELVAAGLLTAAIWKSSQFPLTALFARSMEGPTPASALGYAGLSAHVGTVLLAATMPMWYCFDWARVLLGAVGTLSAVHGTLVSKTRAERKGSIANATSATVGLIFLMLSFGYSDLALLSSLGHAAFRMRQILMVPNIISESQKLRSALGYMPWPRVVPDSLYRLSWMLRRIDTDGHFLHLLHRLSGPIQVPKQWRLTKFQQWTLTAGTVVLAGAPFTPLSHYMEELLMDLLPTQPLLATAIMAGHFGLSVLSVRFLLVHVLNARRFHNRHTSTIDEKTNRMH